MTFERKCQITPCTGGAQSSFASGVPGQPQTGVPVPGVQGQGVGKKKYTAARVSGFLIGREVERKILRGLLSFPPGLSP